ncbi:MAG TPA: PIN domain-containing protein [Baekduia sp.]|nr:PIN domain-containing protein [Baekduia sp.]
MGVVVFDSDVLIGFLNADDAHHEQAVEQVRAALAPGTRRLLCAVNYAEILIGPLRAGREEHVKQMLTHFTIDTVHVDGELAERAATVRARTGLKLPDAFALATVAHAEHGGSVDVSLASFDTKVLKAHAALRAPG